jgi:hypothetical protein
MPETLEARVIAAFRSLGGGPLLRKTSCAVSYVHGLPDYNGHVGIRELCDICPAAQLKLCENSHQVPATRQVEDVAAGLPEAAELQIMEISERAILVNGLPDEQPRYFLQHALAFQVHDVHHPHRPQRHGRADIGWEQA